MGASPACPGLGTAKKYRRTGQRVGDGREGTAQTPRGTLPRAPGPRRPFLFSPPRPWPAWSRGLHSPQHTRALTSPHPQSWCPRRVLEDSPRSRRAVSAHMMHLQDDGDAVAGRGGQRRWPALGTELANMLRLTPGRAWWTEQETGCTCVNHDVSPAPSCPPATPKAASLPRPALSPEGRAC